MVSELAGGHKEVMKVLWMLLDFLISCPDSFQRNIENRSGSDEEVIF